MTSIVVWLMVGLSYGGPLVYGPEFRTQKLCEAAAQAIVIQMSRRDIFGNPVEISVPKCVRIEK